MATADTCREDNRLSDLVPSPRSILLFAKAEAREAMRNRWFLLNTAAFVALALGISWLSAMGTGRYGLGGFGRTAAGLVNLVMLIVPLMSLMASAGSLAGEREKGTLAFLLAQPVTRVELLLGKWLGLALSLLASLALGFGVGGAVLAWKGGSADAGGFLRLAAASYGLALATLSIGFLVSACCRRQGAAMAWALVLWLLFALAGDLVLMGSALALKLEVRTLLGASLATPLQVFKMLAMGGIHASLDLLGPAGTYAVRSFGAWLVPALVAMLAAWVVVPLAVAAAIFGKRGAA